MENLKCANCGEKVTTVFMSTIGLHASIDLKTKKVEYSLPDHIRFKEMDFYCNYCDEKVTIPEEVLEEIDW